MPSMGSWLIFLACLTAAILAIPAASHTGVETTFSIACSSAAFAGMAMSQLLATRIRPVEYMFGGLDRVYAAHRKLGISIFVLILAHYFVTPNFKGLALTSQLNKLAGDVGEFAFYTLITLMAISLVGRIPKTRVELPYQVWRFTHRFMGLAFVLVAIHLNFIKRPFDSTAMLAVYLNLCAAVGVASYVYTQVLAPLRRRAYQVAGVTAVDGATLVMATPTGRAVKAKPGQFAFLKAQKKGLREPHPFTIARIGDDGSVGFAIKPLGDFTSKLREELKPGDRLTIEGGYGHFNYARGSDKQVWLAGGIGITPFLAMSAAMTSSEEKLIHLVYCVKEAGEAIGTDTLSDTAARVPGFSWSLHASSQGRLDAQKLVDQLPFDAKGAELWFCGPAPLRAAIQSGLKKIGSPPSKVEFERFEFR